MAEVLKDLLRELEMPHIHQVPSDETLEPKLKRQKKDKVTKLQSAKPYPHSFPMKCEVEFFEAKDETDDPETNNVYVKLEVETIKREEQDEEEEAEEKKEDKEEKAYYPDSKLNGEICQECGEEFHKRWLWTKHIRQIHLINPKNECIDIPKDVPDFLLSIVEKIKSSMDANVKSGAVKNGRKRGVNGRKNQTPLTEEVIEHLSQMEKLSEIFLSPGDKSKLFSHLASYLQYSEPYLKQKVKEGKHQKMGQRFSQNDIHAMTERMKHQITTIMPDAIATHNAKCQRISASGSKTFGPVKTFPWTPSLKENFKLVVEMCLRNIRLSEKICKNVSEKEICNNAEEHLKKFLSKTILKLWPKEWMSERILMVQCRGVFKDFLKDVAEKVKNHKEGGLRVVSINGEEATKTDDMKANDTSQDLSDVKLNLNKIKNPKFERFKLVNQLIETRGQINDSSMQMRDSRVQIRESSVRISDASPTVVLKPETSNIFRRLVFSEGGKKTDSESSNPKELPKLNEDITDVTDVIEDDTDADVNADVTDVITDVSADVNTWDEIEEEDVEKVIFPKEDRDYTFQHMHEFQCEYCSDIWSTVESVSSHILEFHWNLLRYQCIICKFRHSDQQLLKKHIAEKHRDVEGEMHILSSVKALHLARPQEPGMKKLLQKFKEKIRHQDFNSSSSDDASDEEGKLPSSHDDMSINDVTSKTELLIRPLKKWKKWKLR